jgi:hypothetical protein
VRLWSAMDEKLSGQPLRKSVSFDGFCPPSVAAAAAAAAAISEGGARSAGNPPLPFGEQPVLDSFSPFSAAGSASSHRADVLQDGHSHAGAWTGPNSNSEPFGAPSAKRRRTSAASDSEFSAGSAAAMSQPVPWMDSMRDSGGTASSTLWTPGDGSGDDMDFRRWRVGSR